MRTVADDIEYHWARAQAERECAGRAATVPAARAHSTLAELHLEMVRALTESLSPELQAVS